MVHAHLPLMGGFYPYGGIPVFANFLGIEFAITHATNTGTVWGLFANAGWMLVALRFVLIGFIARYLWKLRYERIAPWALTLLLAGAVGNVVDFFAYGHVVDLLSFRLWGWHYPIFNLADSAICLGVLTLVGRSCFAKRVAN